MELSSTSPTSAPLNVANVFFFALVIAVSLLVIDLFFFVLLDLLKNAEALLILLLCEGFVLLFVGSATWSTGEHEFVVLGFRRPKIYHLSYSPRYPDLYLSIAIAGVLLILVAVYLVGQYY